MTEHDPSLRQLALAVVILIAIAACSTATYICGYGHGIQHAIEDCEITITTLDPPDYTHDIEVNIELDDNVYVHYGWIG